MQNETKEMCLEREHRVVMHNQLVRSRSNLSLNEIKLLRLTIMQVIREDSDFKTYKVSVIKLADMLQIDNHNIYRDIYTMCDNLMNEKIYMGNAEHKKKWKIFHWCSSCEYDNGMIIIRLHDDLKPYLLELSGLYTQYMLQDILLLKSIYSIRLYELIIQEIKNEQPQANETANVYLSVDTIRRATNTESSYKNAFSMFEKRIVSSSVCEINEKLKYDITYTKEKESRRVVGFLFKVRELS